MKNGASCGAMIHSAFRKVPVRGIRALAAEALGRLGVKSGPTRFEQAYRAGETTQVPAGRVIIVKKWVRRKIGHNGTFVSFERACLDTKPRP